MARSLRIPGLVHLVHVDDRSEIRSLSLDRRLDRRFEARGPLINRFLAGRIRRVLSLSGKRLPAVAARGDRKRLQQQEALSRRLARSPAAQWNPKTVAALADAVRVVPNAPDLAVATQEAVGGLFARDYRADARSWAAAVTLDRAVRARNPLRSLLWFVTGKVRRARRLLATKVRGDLAGVHATGIAVHNLVRALRCMRDLWREPGARRRLSTEAAVGRCLVAPQSVLRQATERGATAVGEVRRGTLILLRLDAARERAPGADMVFMEGTWARCPAAEIVPALLRAVWEQALAAEAAEQRG